MKMGAKQLLDERQKAKALKLYREEKLSFTAIAERFGVSDGTIGRIIKEMVAEGA